MRLPLSWKNRVSVERLGTRNWYLADAASGETVSYTHLKLRKSVIEQTVNSIGFSALG